MKITRKLLTKLGACKEGKEWALALPTNDPIEVIKALHKHRFYWANWLLPRLLTRENAVRYAVYAARLALPIFEEEHPDNDRPRKVIEAAERYLKNPTKINVLAVDAAVDAARTTRTADAAYAAYAAATAVATATSATYVAPAAARAAARAADEAALAGAPKSKLINYGLRLLRKRLKGESI